MNDKIILVTGGVDLIQYNMRVYTTALTAAQVKTNYG